jgi:hypothetical protein
MEDTAEEERREDKSGQGYWWIKTLLFLQWKLFYEK